MLRNSGKPELRCNPSLRKKMDARAISAFTRVFDALLPGNDGARALRLAMIRARRKIKCNESKSQ